MRILDRLGSLTKVCGPENVPLYDTLTLDECTRRYHHIKALSSESPH